MILDFLIMRAIIESWLLQDAIRNRSGGWYSVRSENSKQVTRQPRNSKGNACAIIIRKSVAFLIILAGGQTAALF